MQTYHEYILYCASMFNDDQYDLDMYAKIG